MDRMKINRAIYESDNKPPTAWLLLVQLVSFLCGVAVTLAYMGKHKFTFILGVIILLLTTVMLILEPKFRTEEEGDGSDWEEAEQDPAIKIKSNGLR